MIFELLTGIFLNSNVLSTDVNSAVQGTHIEINTASPAAGAFINPTPIPTTKPPATIKPSTVAKSTPASALTTQSILNALNAYRAKNGVGSFQLDSRLQSYAQSRADYLKSIGKLDNHAKHKEFMANNGFSKLGFNAIAENQGYNYKGNATGLVESFYGKSSGHNKNQLNSEYTHVGIGINGPFTDLVFGGRKR